MNDSSPYNELYLLSLSFVIAKLANLFAELKLDQFLKDEPRKISELAEAMSLHPEALYRFLRVLSAYKVVDLIEPDQVSANSMTKQLAKINSPHIGDGYELFSGALHTLKTNQPAWKEVFGQSFYETINADKAKTSVFREWNTLTAGDWLPPVFNSYDFSWAKTVVDVGGGAGYFIKNILERYLDINGVLYDQEGVVGQSVFSNTSEFDGRIEVTGGDFFKHVPSGGDLYTVCRTLLNWNDEKSINLLENCHQAIQKNGKLLIVDFFLPEPGDPKYLQSAVNDLYLFVAVDSAIRTEAQWRQLIDQTPFKLSSFIRAEDTAESSTFCPMCLIELTV
jgi:SAM-dependent methyltransferase